MKRYNERHYDVWRTIWHQGSPAIISICWLVMARIYSPVVSFYLSTVSCRNNLSLLVSVSDSNESTSGFQQNYKARSKMAGTTSTITRLAVGGKVSRRVAISGQAKLVAES